MYMEISLLNPWRDIEHTVVDNTTISKALFCPELRCRQKRGILLLLLLPVPLEKGRGRGRGRG